MARSRTWNTLMILAAAATIPAWTACPASSTPGSTSNPDVQAVEDAQPGEAAEEPGPAPDFGPLADGAVCAPGATQCVGTNYLQCKSDGSDWTVTICGTGTSCTRTGCSETLCHPNIPECDEGGKVIVCLPDGSGWGTPAACKADQVCKAGQCLPTACSAGSKECTQTALLVCQGDPPAWVEVPCGKDQVCFKGDCVDCFSD